MQSRGAGTPVRCRVPGLPRSAVERCGDGGLPAVPAPAPSPRQASGARVVPSPSRNVQGESCDRRRGGRAGAVASLSAAGKRSPAPEGLRKEEA